MTYSELNRPAQSAVREMVRVFHLQELQLCDKFEMSRIIAEYVNAFGQDGNTFVQIVLNDQADGYAPDEQAALLLRQFLITSCKMTIKKHGYAYLSTEEFEDLAGDIMTQALSRIFY